jgi:micrococcal nuclease
MFAAALALTLCPAQGYRADCIHDGDTGWFGREKWRIENIDTPELDGKCQSEIDRAIAARNRLLAILRSGPISLTRHGQDRSRRTLVRISVNGRDVGRQLIAEGHARPWAGRREPWC